MFYWYFECIFWPSPLILEPESWNAIWKSLSSVQISHSVMSNCLQCHEPQHIRPPCLSPTQWTWVWVDCRSWWWTGSPGVLRFVGSQRVRQDWATELNWTDSAYKLNKQGDNITALMYSFPNLQPVCCSMYSFNCCFLTCIQISQETGQMVWYSHLFQNFYSFLWSTQSKALA